MIYSPADIIVREIGGGVWFFMSAALTFAFVGYVIRQRWRYWFYPCSPETLVAIALSMFCAGSAMRALLTWMQFLYLANGWNPRAWIDTWPWFGGSVILNIAGAIYAIWLLSPKRWRVLTTGVSLALAVLVPVMLFWAL